MKTDFHTLVIGAGIAGLVAAYRLHRAGRAVLLIESGDRAGGIIRSQDAEGFLLERGPNSFRGTHELLDLIDEVGLAGDLVAADPRAPAYVYAGGALHAVPMSPPALIKTRLLSTAGKLRLLREPFVRPRREPGEESVASFVRRRLGPEVLERLVAPFVSGIYAGDPGQLSVQASFARLAALEVEGGSLLRGAWRAARRARAAGQTPARSLRPYRLCSFRGGLEQLPRALAAALGPSLLTGARVTRLSADGHFALTILHQGAEHTHSAANLIVATPAAAAAALLRGLAPEVADLVAPIPYVGLASVPLAYRVGQVARRLDGFGFLAPRGEGLRALGSVWNSSLFPGRAPDGWALLTSFVGGATDPEAVALGDEELARIVHSDLRRALGVEGEPRRLPVTRWERAIPQYPLGHAARVAQIEAALGSRSGLHLVGNYLRGVSLGDCVLQAARAAEKCAASS